VRLAAILPSSNCSGSGAQLSYGPRWLLPLCVVLMLGCAGVLDTIVAASMSATGDESAQIEYGRKILHLQPDRDQMWFDSKAPVTALNALPHALARRLVDRHMISGIAWLVGRWKLARVASVLSLLLLDFIIFQWAYTLYGWHGGLASLMAAVLSPNLIAHGTLATTDGYFALAVLLSLHFFRRYLLQPTFKNACLSGFALALSQLTKAFAIYLYPVVFLFLILTAFSRRGAPSITRTRLALYGSAAALLFLLVVNAGYCFDRVFTPLRLYHFESTSFIHLQQLNALRDVRVPVAYPFLDGLDMMKFNETTGVSFGNVYLLGELRSVSDPQFHSFRTYYLVAWFFKEPIALQILFALGLLGIMRNRTRDEFLRGEALLLVAAGALGLWLSFFNNAQIGIRHLLPALAVEVVIAGAAFASFASLSRVKQAALGVLFVWLALSVFSYFPHMIPYMNEWVVDRRFSYEILGDSNLDWGQNDSMVRQFLRRNRDVILNPQTPVCGRVLVSVNRLVGILPRGQKRVHWAMQYRPVAHVGYAHLLYVIPALGGAGRQADGCAQPEGELAP
jgi:hypothetical protein